MTNLAHAKLSPSGAHRWIRCPGSVALESGMPDTSSSYADEGTAAHELASMALTNNLDAAAYMGRIISVLGRNGAKSRDFTVDDEMATEVQKYLDAVRQCAKGGELLVEQRLEFSEYVGVADQFGTSDSVILLGDELQVHDLKYGKGVRVDAEENEQLQLYALGALATFSILGDFKRVRMFIHQPRLDHMSEWDCTVEELLAFAERAKAAAYDAMNDLSNTSKGCRPEQLTLNPGDKQCKWCKAKASCPALSGEVSRIVYGDSSVLGNKHETAKPQSVPASASLLGTYMDRLELVEEWCKAIRAKVYTELDSGAEVPGWKMVQGRKGNRAWSDKDAAAAHMKGMRLKHEDIYEYTLISPTTAAEKLEKEYPRAWPKLAALITQADGKPTVAAAGDKRAPIVKGNALDDIEDLTASADLV